MKHHHHRNFSFFFIVLDLGWAGCAVNYHPIQPDTVVLAAQPDSMAPQPVARRTEEE
ncbi:hypothetical protein [Lewinella sp. LCG006]|uniref:hypothetical protein n=1 Tax=Lewinella sp. LCG006 TaxID=3231911 RepID=UPI00345F98EB